MIKFLKTYSDAKSKAKRLKAIEDIAKGKKSLVLKNNKELTEVDEFHFLLSLFNNVTLKEIALTQNTNDNITNIGKTIYDMCSIMQGIRRCIDDYDAGAVRMIGRLPERKVSSYLFFNDKEQVDANNIFDNRTLAQLVAWMNDILIYFEQNKTSQDERVELLCLNIYSRLDVFYISYYQLLCHVLNIRCDHLGKIVKFDNTEI